MTDLLLLAQDEAPANVDPAWWQLFLQNPIFLLIGMMVLFYVIVLVPDRRRRAQQAQRLNELKKNDRIVTVGGIHGTVVNAPADSKEIVVRIDESTGVKVRLNRSAVADVVSDETPAES